VSRRRWRPTTLLLLATKQPAPTSSSAAYTTKYSLFVRKRWTNYNDWNLSIPQGFH
jgi:hypothetical protein